MTKSKQAGPAPRRRTFSDPLEAWAPKPPPNETLEEKERRLTEEFTAKKHSDGIDEMLRQERNERKKPKNEVKLLLLGQSESGKSTTLKPTLSEFQLLHTPSAFHAERIAWRAVIYLNLVRSIRRILDAISPEAIEEDIESAETASIIISSNTRSHSLSGSKSPDYDKFRKRLEPLVALEDRLIRLLSSPDEDEPTRFGPAPGQWEEPSTSGTNSRPSPSITIPEHRSKSSPVTPVTLAKSNSNVNRNKEVTVHTSTNWKKAFELGRSRSPKSAHSGEIEGWWEDPEDPVHVLHACAPAMDALWHDPRVRDRLEEKRLRLEESSGFFLDDIRRITALKYIPTNEDVLKARLKTLGVVEHKFTVASAGRNVDWRIYDVGGSRNQRATWVPYFEDVNAIIFLAPISAFDQVLAEDHRVNRLEDSLLLWKTVVSNKLLQKVNLILFLNKADLLQAKLDAGVRLNQHMITYGDRPNDFESIAKYFRNKFGALHQSFTPNKERELYIHFTSVTDTRHTSLIIANVRDIIVKANLRTLKLV